MKLVVPELILGMLLTIAVLAMGFMFAGQVSFRFPEQVWLTRDASGFFTFLLFVVAVFQLCLFYWQLRYMSVGIDAGRLAAEAAQVSAKMAESQAAIATESLNASQLTARSQLRAYMGMRDNGTTYDAMNGDIKLMFKNYGATPAKQVSLWRRIVPDTEMVGEFAYSDEGGWVSVNQITHPGQHFGQVVGKLVSPSPSHVFFVYGFVDYLDAFDKPWRYRFAYAHNQIRGGDAWRAYLQHNNEIEQPESGPHAPLQQQEP